jgi:acetolactate synthase-1/2/3 large subunit
MRYSGAEIVIRQLERAGVTIVSGIPGGANLPLYHALSGSSIRHILARHEQGAGFIAHGIARSSGKPGVCFATSGPGATNLVTALADAKLDSVPVIAITGQVPTSMIGTDAFQEVDTYGMTLAITKHNFLVKSAEQLLTIIPRAFTIAVSGRPGPVLIDIPKDVQLQQIEIEQWPAPGVRAEFPAIDQTAVADAAAMIARAKRPVIYAGGGVIRSGCHGPLHELAKKNGIPVALTLMGLGAFPPDDPLYLGMLGMHGSPLCNIALDDADLVLALGSRFDDRAVGRADQFCPKAEIIHVDVDAAEIHKIKRVHLPIVGDLGLVITALLPQVGSDSRHAWLSRLSEIRAALPCGPFRRNGGLHPIDAIKTAHSLAPADTIVCTDVGQHQMWVAQAYPFAAPGTFLTSGGLGTMGFGLPAAIGAALANPGRRVLCISGDGSFQMNIQELATLAELGLPVTILLLNNGHLGLVRQQQELFYGGNYIASRFDLQLDFAAISRQFGIHGFSVRQPASITDILREALSHDGPSLVDIPVHHEENVFPMVPPGRANTDMIGIGLWA